ncbi:cadmium-translocating P-type ATPase [Rhizobacter sp. J219]|uniref:heavy metal translocating P-type ATPase n=1 Tax=Rhizobacter sp. J219 TaxID=2898430 RepID=UPI0021509339|nr:cation-translocating P-type ATPase [Rhizobacter sp. J219]MCR5882447.1 cadmium-translocating P-type ATPase [Rhizobacter sp. J219]
MSSPQAGLALPLPPLSAREKAALDDDASLERCTRWRAAPDGSREAESVFALQGMYCAACAGLIEAALKQVPGVARAEVNAASQRALVQWDPSRTRASALVDAVQAAGYRALPAEHEAARTARLRESRQALWRLFVAGFCMMQVMMLTTPGYLAEPGEIAPDLAALMSWAAWVLTLPVLLFSAGPFFKGAWHALRRRRIGMDVPVALGIAVTFIAGTAATFEPGGAFGADPYLDSMTMFVSFLLAGRWLELRARHRSTEALDALLQRLPDAVERLDDDGSTRTVPVARLRVGDRVRVAAGQAFPGDALVLEGSTQVDEAMLTGESRPVERAVGDAVVGGSLNLAAPVVVRVQQLGEGTRYQQIVELLQHALTERPGVLRLADRWAGPFLFGVLLLAAGAAAVWSVIDPSRAVWVAVAVLIVTCPCALSLATPAALLAATGGLARRGVLVQRLDAIEALGSVDTAVFDKTGTLTQDSLVLAATHLAPNAERAALLARAASLAALSRHPLSVALVQALPPATHTWREVHEVAGQGVEALDGEGRRWRLGAAAWVGVATAHAGSRPRVACAPVGASLDEQVLFEFDEALRSDAQEALQSLVAHGLQVRLLSGDADGSVRAVADRLGIAQAQAEASPEDKLRTIESLQGLGHRVLMVGDGLNDGPVLARADVSFALAHGSALAQQRSDFIVLGSRLGEIPAALERARKTVRVMRQNLAWALAYNAACVPLALLGYLPPWAAGLGMAASSLLVVLNALRLSR